ncbi:MAG TPA: DUF1552 domain-containing protein [Kofleriaceae bacterium]|nr:DUF1552 domain-containing protein [Kofleriaceae bacterium]
MTTRKSDAPSRRSLLKWGLAASALPLLRYMPRAHAAAPAGTPQRLILFPSLNGAAPEHFWPTNPTTMNLVTEPLARWANQMTFVRGLDIEGSYNHFAVRSMFTGAPVNDYLSPDPGVKSVDQVVADHFASTQASSLRSLHLGAIPADSIQFYQLYGRSTFFFNPTPVHYEANPVTAFDATFGGLGGGGPTPAPATDYKSDVLALTGAELGVLEQKLNRSPRELKKVRDHGAALTGLGASGPAAPVTCSGGSLPSVEALRGRLAGNAAAAYDYSLFGQIMDAQIDILARAVVCGLTRVATLQAGSADGNVIVPVDGGYPHHNTSHGDARTFARVQRWYAEKLARLLTALDVPDPLDNSGKTVLQNSCVVWLSECNPGHDSADVPAFYVGGAGGALKTGTVLNLPGATNRGLLKAICRGMGVPDSATGHFGSTVLSEVLS